MQIDLRTVAIKPLRNTFDHLARRFGDKPASRYQEGTYDLQATDNLQYRPTWDPDHELHDVRRTRLVMADWYALKDPRQFYYGTYVIARARQQDAAEANFTYVESRGLIDNLDPTLKQSAIELLVPLRHVAWAANLNNNFICSYGYGTAVTQACSYHAADHLGIAQYLTRIGMLMGDVDSLEAAKEAWLKDTDWQGLRRYMERLLVTRDWFELFVAQNLVLDGLMYPLIYENLVEKRLVSAGGTPVSVLCAFMTDWYAEGVRWVDATIKTAASESAENKALLEEWTRSWRDRALAALVPVAAQLAGKDADDLVATVAAAFNARAAKAGLTV